MTKILNFKNYNLLENNIASTNVNIKPENLINMTSDNDDNYIFYHVSHLKLDVISPSRYGSNPKAVTSKSEIQAITSIGGISMYYTRPDIVENSVNAKYKFMVKIHKDKVYDCNLDINNYNAICKLNFNNMYPNMAYTANHQILHVTKMACDNGYLMSVCMWGGDKTRAQTTVELSAIDTQILDGYTIVKKFKNEYIPNIKKFDAVTRNKSKVDSLHDLYNEINIIYNNKQNYSDLYRLYTNSFDFSSTYDVYKSQEEITSDIMASTILDDRIKKTYLSLI